jgi:hypothetical protein
VANPPDDMTLALEVLFDIRRDVARILTLLEEDDGEEGASEEDS